MWGLVPTKVVFLGQFRPTGMVYGLLDKLLDQPLPGQRRDLGLNFSWGGPKFFTTQKSRNMKVWGRGQTNFPLVGALAKFYQSSGMCFCGGGGPKTSKDLDGISGGSGGRFGPVSNQAPISFPNCDLMKFLWGPGVSAFPDGFPWKLLYHGVPRLQTTHYLSKMGDGGKIHWGFGAGQKPGFGSGFSMPPGVCCWGEFG